MPRDGIAVLNADDPLVAAMSRACSGSVIYFSMDPDHERLKFQASRGRRAVTLEQGRNGEMIVLRQGRKSMSLVWTHLIPATFEGRARMNVQNALAATAAAWAGGAHLHDIRQGLRTFTTSYFMAPGRLNMFELDGYRVVVDYAHNPPAMRALGEFVDLLTQPSAGGARPPVTGRRIGVIATAGDRRDEDIVELGNGGGRLLRRDHRARGREQPWPAARRHREADRRGRLPPLRPMPHASARSPPSSTSSRPPAMPSIMPARETSWSSASITQTRSGRSSSGASTATAASRMGCAPWSA